MPMEANGSQSKGLDFSGFIFATVLTMGVFAAAYGELTYTLGKECGARFERGLKTASSGACATVGVGWVYLTTSGIGLGE